MTTAKNLALQPGSASNRVNNDGHTLVRSFAELADLCAGDSRFGGTEFTSLGENSFNLRYKDRDYQVVNRSIWADIDAMNPLIQKATADKNVLICVVEDADADTYRRSFEEARINALPFPLSVAQISGVMHDYFATNDRIDMLQLATDTASEESESVKYILSVSRELNGVRDIDRLLSLILKKAREITEADAGSIYVVESEIDDIRNGYIHFKITQNESVNQDLTEFKLPINEHSIVGAAVIHNTAINIPDLYQLSEVREENPYGAKHDRQWDIRSGYECHSMLTLPMYDIAHNVVGVIQLINRKRSKAALLKTPEDFAREVIPFDEKTIEYAEIVAQQAGIALENAMLTEEKEALFEGFVNASVKAIEQRDPTTSGHSHRVAQLTLELAKKVDRIDDGVLAATSFNEDQLKEIEYASLLHDFGKLGVREQVLVKAKKLYPWEFDLLLERFELIHSRIELEHVTEVMAFLRNPGAYPPGFSEDYFEAKKKAKIEELEKFHDFIMKANEPTVLEQHGFEKLKDIANINFKDSKGKKRPYLLATELKSLSVSRGSLTAEEFGEIQSHVEHTYEFLRKIPWGRKFANVPQIAAKHHEKLDGSGYPNAAVAEEIPIQSRMMTIADIFDALTASDRPYKRAVPAPRALEILEMEVKAKKCDPLLFKIFVDSGIYKSVL